MRLGAETDWGLMIRFCERCEALSARHVPVAGDDADHARLAESVARFCALAAPHRLTADLEFMPWTAIPDIATALRIVETSGAANGGVLVDALHYDRSATTLAEIAAVPRGRVNYVQVCDGAVPYGSSDDEPIRVEGPNRPWWKSSTPGRAAMALAATKGILRRAGPVLKAAPPIRQLACGHAGRCLPRLRR